jgi:hypothetical protein
MISKKVRLFQGLTFFQMAGFEIEKILASEIITKSVHYSLAAPYVKEKKSLIHSIDFSWNFLHDHCHNS